MFDTLGDILARQWSDLIARPSGPFAFRFVLQPIMATIAAIKAGLVDARTGRTPYFWLILSDPAQRGPSVREGLAATSRIFLLGLLIDAAYQLIALKKFYPVEALIIAIVLAVVPYFLIRGPVARIARWWHSHHPAPHGTHSRH